LQHRWIATAETVLVIVDEHADQSLWQPRRRVGALGKILALRGALQRSAAWRHVVSGASWRHAVPEPRHSYDAGAVCRGPAGTDGTGLRSPPRWRGSPTAAAAASSPRRRRSAVMTEH